MSAMNKMIENIKQVHPDFVLCYKVGSFYQVYGRDAYIVAYVFGYKINYIKQNIPSVGFPLKASSKVQATLEQKKINYMFLDPRNNYDVDVKCDNKNLNQYKIILERATNYIRLQRRIDEIYENLMLEIEEATIKNKIEKIEEIVYENRKI